MSKVKLDKFITIQKAKKIPDGIGGYNIEWEFYKNKWAKIDISQDGYTFIMRKDQIAADMRIVLKDLIFEIINISPIELKKGFLYINTQLIKH
jgi:head-tail adaptor